MSIATIEKSSHVVLDPEKVLAALGNRLRWQMLKILADGTAMHAAEMARQFDRDFDGISKHLRILRAAGVLESRRGKDRRVEEYFVPPVFRKKSGQLEFGFCLMRLSEAMPDPEIGPPKEPPPPDDFEEEEVPVQGFGEMLVNSTARGSGRDS